jgi:hypothetical protein
MGRVLIGSAVLVLGFIVWLLTARQLATFLDRFWPSHWTPLPAGPLQCDEEWFRVGAYPMELRTLNGQRSDLSMATDARNRLTFSFGGQSITLGPQVDVPDKTGHLETQLVAEPGDEVSFATARGMSWPTPFEFNFMTGHSPSSRRYAYHRLVWKKPSGARLEMSWRYLQGYYAKDGWDSPLTVQSGSTGRLRQRVSSGPQPHASFP